MLAASGVCTLTPSGAQPDPDRVSTQPRIEVVGHDPVVAATGTFTAFLDVSGVTAGTSIAVDIYPRIDSTSRLDAAIDGAPTDSAATFDVIPIEVDATNTPHRTGFSIALGTPARPRPPAAWTRTIDKPGVYPIKVRLRDHDGATLHQIVTYLVRAPEPDDEPSDVEPVQVALLLHLSEDLADAAPASSVEEETAIDPEVLADTDQLLAVLSGRPDLAATLLVEPDLATRLADDDEGAGRIEGLREVLTPSHRELLGTTYVPVEAEALIDADMATELSHQLDLGRQVLTATLTDPAAGLFHLSSPVDTRTVTALTELGVTDVVAVPGVMADEPTRTHPHVAPIRSEPKVRAAAVDEAFDLATALAGPDAELAVSRTLGHVLALAHLADGGPAQVVVRVDLHRVDIDRLTMLLGRLDDAADLVDLTTVSTLFDDPETASPGTQPETDDADPADPIEPAPTVDLADHPRSDLGQLRPRLAEVRRLVTSFASMGFEGDTLWPFDRTLARSLDSTRPERSRLELVQLVEDSVSADLATITIPERERVTLGTRDAEFPLSIRSGLDAPATVLVEFSSSDRLELPQEQLEVVLDGDRTTVQVPVRALTTGDTPLQITVRTPDGAVLLAETTYAIRSTAVSGVGIVLTVGAGAFLVVWWGRHIWRHRRDQTTTGRHAA